ncbi:outer membrane lipoprotein carrier protein LolA [Iodidimonas sp. SYSU 1G8]|uniref:LolA family protein n=1 Tax=Iodidimonas sp. SYSU 1G8 TaxID=3133967 RepID=UPI0031FE6680
MIRHAVSALALMGLVAGAAVTTAVAAPPAKTAAPALSTTEAQDMAAVQAYLKNIKSLRARFNQVAPNMAVSSGTLSLEKPGKLRFEYEPPSPLLVVADGKIITLVDYDLKQVTRWPINDTPLRALVRSDIIFGQDVQVLRMRRNADRINVAIVDPKKRDEGTMMLTFSRNPLKLTEWEVVDERGASTIVALDDLETNVDLSKSLWSFKDPRPQRGGPPTK